MSEPRSGGGMSSGRLEAFTDGVVAIIITIMVLELKVPRDGSLAALSDSLPILLAYILSFINVGLYWNNHHHLLHAADRIDGKVLWANLFLLFWLSLVPFVIRWLDASGFSAMATASYGVVLAMAAIGYEMTERAIIACNGAQSALARAVGSDRKGKITLALYAVAVPAAFFARPVAIALYIIVLLPWLAPDRRIERALGD
ncbi:MULTISPECIES: TMEM175 family protein [unclassified Sphingobium]|uniref:TMEM175 family protein n=1 Tax=unclassified Sphingobium TaxID=2611147 RepID=UPI0011994468|nr:MULTISPECIES: TMEM175 family protein [unclassified Sphingobium]MBG6119835.1 putative membrane protein [Sphingobium sp. JAI105]TWC97192.1 putative membrane protein [Sphingobium sp. AEW010]TWD17366.1 putative membrane protein [Sphingobium sp. AEW013]TWD19894.1 putative membrane protein [Sphingobium sp. AEW001]